MAAKSSSHHTPVTARPAREDEAVVVVLARGLGVVARGVVYVASLPHRAMAAAFAQLRTRGRRRRIARRSLPGSRAAAGLVGRRLGRDAINRVAPPVDFAPARLAADDGLAALAQALSSPDPQVRTASLEVVCEFSADRAARLLAGMIHDPDAMVRCAAAAAAARVGAEQAVSSLIVALDDPVPDVRRAASDAIEDITGRVVRFTDENDPRSRQDTVCQLKDWWKTQRVAQLTASFRRSEVL